MLDLGCGENKQENFTGIDKRDLPGVDIVHDLEVFPWPLEDESCMTVVGAHIFEHIKPWLTIDFMNECHRILVENGQLMLAVPYGWSKGYIQDPTHCNPVNEVTWQYFDPDYELYKIYEPKAWKIEKGFPQYQTNGNLEVLMKKSSNHQEILKEEF
jgi:predicted SAM-dependent methyltransferase